MEARLDFDLQFRTANDPTGPSELLEWLTERGEPAVCDGDQVLCKALPLNFDCSGDALGARLRVAAGCPLSRVIDTVFGVSIRAGADVSITGIGEVSRAMLWLLLADEQDRVRLADALERAREHASCTEIMRRLWAVVHELRHERQDRWDASQCRIVEVFEVGQGIPLSAARQIDPGAEQGDEIAIPVKGHLHTLAWRWLSEAYPGLAEAERTLH